MLANEIQAIKKVNDVIKAYQESNKLSESYMKISKDAVPEIIHYGILLLYNFDNSKPLNKEDDKIT